MSILRDIHIKIKPLFDGSDDIDPLGDALAKLTPEEREEWNREYDIFEKYIPQFGCGDAAYDAAEDEIIATMPAGFIA